MSEKKQIEQLKGPIVVFGAGGFIGANLLRQLLKVRSDVYGVTHQQFVPWRLLSLPTENLLRCDVTSPLEVETLFRKYSFQTIFCLSAYGAYSRQKETDLIYQTNLLGLVHILNAGADQGFSALVHAGSSSEYGTNCQGPLEKDSLLPNSHYAVSKVAASHLLQYVATAQRLPVMNLRLYSVYGPWEEPDRLVPQLIETGLRGIYPPFVDPDISRDFVYIDDTVEAMVLAANVGVKSHPGASINIGTGQKTTIRQIAALSKEIFSLEKDPQWGAMPNRHWDLRDWFANPTLAEKALGWKPRTPLKQGLELTRDWIKEQAALPASRPQVELPAAARLSIVIACYKDAEAISVMHERLTQVLQKLRVEYEIIFVNDASPDNSSQVLKELSAKDEHVIAIEHSRNFGSQSAFLSGMEISTGNAVVLMDGDLQDPPELIASFYEKWITGNEVVYGRRVKREASFVLQICYKAFYRLFKKMAYVPVPLDAGDFSLLDRKVVKELLALPETDQFLRGLRAWVGFKQTGVDYVRPERMFGTSTNNWRKNFWWARKAIFNFSFMPLEMLVYSGIALTALSFLGLAAQVIAKFIWPDVPHGVTTIIVLILFFGGVQLLAISTLGEYLGKILEETKRRPKFIRRAIHFSGRELLSHNEMEDFVKVRTQFLREPARNTL